MHPIKFPEANITFAEDQPEYMALPAHCSGDIGYPITCCWQLSWKERLQILFSGKIWHQIHTFSAPLQPQLLLAKKPEMK